MSDASQGTARRGRVIAAVVFLSLLVGAAVAFRRPARPVLVTAKPSSHDLVVSIMSDGTLEPPPGGELRAPANATVREIGVAEGQRVTRGTPLVRLSEPDLSQSALAARSGAVGLAEERSRVAAELDSARRESEHLRGVFESDLRLLAQSAIPRATRDADELAFRQSQDRVRQARARLESVGDRSAGHASRLRLADVSARELERRVAALTLRAPADGIVYGLPRKVGESVAAGQLVASVADPQHLRVRARVDQADLPRVSTGQRMIVTFDGLPDKRWGGTVRSVPSGVTEAGGRQVGEVIGEISDPALSLPPNAAVNVQIIVPLSDGERVSAAGTSR
ncbi:MAG: HlyD family efflux transporter periplasmic adaptor subunit [Acidobacteria bacterium]|nr:HlyD family efflux transporter periplasmic adaptor subunit [Acidobacteriota bacterium]